MNPSFMNTLLYWTIYIGPDGVQIGEVLLYYNDWKKYWSLSALYRFSIFRLPLIERQIDQ